MKKAILLSSLVMVIVLTGCMQTRYMTEKYIKTKIENHKENEFSSINTYTIFKGTSYSGGAYFEMTGYKYASSKALVLGADKYYMARQKFKGDQTILADITYIELSLDQCKDIITNYKVLQNKIKVEKPKMSEEIYHDYTVSKDLFISYRKSAGNSNIEYIDFWIQGEKYRILTQTIIKKLNKFINY
jgi:hypothetical protein